MLVVERNSAPARDWIERQEQSALAISGWVIAEVASALAKKQRMKMLTATERARAQRVWTTAFATRIERIEIDREDYDRAAMLVDAGRRGLRAADALHLAIAERRGLAMATLDDDLWDAATAIGLEVPAIGGG